MNQLQKIRVTTLCFSTIFLLSNLIAQPGTLDLSFGDSGKVITEIAASNNIVRAIAIQPDKKILVMSANSDIPSSFYTKIVRYEVDGSIDSSFGNHGIFFIDRVEGFDLKLNLNGNLLLYGQLDFSVYEIIQLTKNGIIDSSFGQDGSTSFYIDQSYPAAGSLMIDTKNNILVSVLNLGVVRFTSSGNFDDSFGVNGFTETNGKIGAGLDYYMQNTFSLAMQADSKILTAGIVSSNGLYFQVAIARYSGNGFLDSSFGVNGTSILNFALDTLNHNISSYLNKILIQSGNKILIGGFTYDGSAQISTPLFARLNENGLYDSTFGANGKSVISQFGSNVSFHTFILKDDGKIIAAGSVRGAKINFALASFLLNGSVDTTFGIKGITITSFGNNSASAYALDFQNNKIIAAGSLYMNNKIYYAITRYKNQSVLPVSLLSFDANKKSNSVLLNWQTANEINNNYFVVEKPSNNNYTAWNALTTIYSKGNSTQTQFYNYEDLHPAKGENYYRLKQVDKDGDFTYSSIVSVDFENGNVIIAYPNPTANILNISGLNPFFSSNLIIEDIKGNTIKTAITNESKYSLNIEHLSKGFYFLKIIQNNKTSMIRVLKK